MGKKKQAQRTKNNVVPASSGRSAELLQSTSSVPLVGFSTLKQGGFIPILSGISDELDFNINEDFRLVWKKMNKKDKTTKLKALEEFKKLCQDSDVEALKPVLPYWPRLFCVLSTDEEHRVREAAHTAHKALVIKAGRNIAPYLKQLVGPWFTGQHDTYPPAASAAESAFHEAFPPNKMVEAIVFCQEEILNYIGNNLLNQTPQTLANNQNCSQEIKDARYQRLVISCLNGYALYLQRLPADHLRKAEEANRKLVSAAKFWKFSKDPTPLIRSAWFTALVALCEKAPFLLTEEAKHICSAVFNNLDETDPAVVRSVWQAVLLSFSVVEDVWKYVNLAKLVLPKLWKVLREGSDGNASLVFPNLLPLLSKISPSLLPDKAQFYTKFFENLRIGLKSRNVQISAKEASAVVTAFLECFRYVVSINCEEEKICLALLEEQVFPLLDCVMTDSKLQLARPGLFSGLASLVNQWSQQACQPSSLYTALTTSFWGRLANTCSAALESHVTDASTLASSCASLEALLTSFKNPDSQSRKNFKVKFVSAKKSQDEIEEPVSPIEESPNLAPSYREELNKLVYNQLSVCFNLMEGCSDRAKVVFVGHLARVLEEYISPEVFSYVLSTSQLSWAQFYRLRLARWLRDDSIPLDYSLRVIFSLVSHVQNDNDVQTVFADLSGDEILAVLSDGNDSQPEPLYVKWQDILEWALCLENQTPCVLRWINSNGDVCRLATSLSRHDPSYNILHNCLRNLRNSTWLSTDSLRNLVRCLRHNLTDGSVADDVKACSGDLVHAMLQNTANHAILARLPAMDLQQLLYELLTATLQHLPHFPSCWQHCVTVLSLQTGADLTFSAACERCIDLLVAVISTRSMDLPESKQLVCVLEDLIQAAVAASTDSHVTDMTASLTAVVLHRLAARIREHSDYVWSLYALAESVAGNLKNNQLPYRQFWSPMSKDPLGSIPLQQYVTSMIPFLMMVVRLQTGTEATDTEAPDTEASSQFPYSHLRSDLVTEDLWDWTLQVLHSMCFCVSFKERFTSTKQYFLLKEKIAFIIEECGMFCQLREKDLISHLNMSLCEEEVTSLSQCDALSKLQKQILLKNLGLLYNKRLLQKGLFAFKSKNDMIKQYYFPEEVLEEITVSGMVNRAQLPTINILYSRLAALQEDMENSTGTAYISIMDSVFDLHVSELKDNRSLLELSDDELCHIAEVADFACHSVSNYSLHMKQSSWDACLVATAALTLCVDSTLKDWSEHHSIHTATQSHPTVPTPSATSQPWPLSLLVESNTVPEDSSENFLRLPLVRVVCSVCRLFDAVSTHMRSVEEEDKAARTRRQEWIDVFLPGTHAAITSAWLSVAGMSCELPSMMLMVEALSSSITRFVEYPHFVDGSPLSCLSTCCQLVQSSESSTQLAAYHLLVKLIPALIELDTKECENNVALSCKHIDQTLIFTQTVIETILSGLSFGDTCIVEPFTDSYTYVRCYLLLWSALLEMCSQASAQLRALYTTWLREGYLQVFMKTVFCLMPEAALHGDVVNQRLVQYFSKPPQLEKGVWGSERLAQLSCWVYGCVLRRLPAAMRRWWNEADHKPYALMEHVTATYVSHDLCAEEMRAIQLHEKKFDNVTVHVISNKEVCAVYTLEESRMELIIELAHNHPLGQVKVKSGQQMVSSIQTRQWLMQITIFLTHQNGSIWDALELWKHNLDKRFEGVEECYICFAILHSVSHQLPKLTCQTCRKKFHSHCLYKWFTTSNKSTCPICRNLF
uniref:E3 ubiquitin-protein ligase listerin n=1 Tax=Cuerna arida TaxID=1464854 RepID=A0A1B6G177_9HEMI